ncbi:sensor histidine kinase [Jannaschia sp. 2305UL9-9]|uniref:sensor histidine kinase n=1 Tax=Jannaschia sp. 2305UL9-9 TaxID=3121638 RepID=UPI00352835B1
MNSQATFRMGPALGTAIAMVLAAIAAVLVTWAALSQPWLGLDKVIGGEGPGIAITGTAPTGPAAGVDGTRLLSIEGADGTQLTLSAQDALEEPDVLPTHAAMAALFAHQGQIHDMLTGGPVTLRTDAGEFVVTPRDSRPFGSLPLIFWIQVFVGMAPIVLGGWVVSLRPRDPAAWLFAMAGLGLALSAMTAAWYSTRDLAVPEAGFAAASHVNMFGSLLFGACMTSMLWSYPRRLLPGWTIYLPLAVFFLWYLGNPLGLWSGRATGAHLGTAVEMACMTLGLLAQIWAARKQPKDRGIALWFGASILLGCGGFIALMAIPGALGYPAALRQGHAFLLFLFVYVGLAIGVARYRMFDLGDWSFRLFYYAGGVALLFAVDAALISAMSLEAVSAFSASLLLVVVLYLPLRDQLASLLRKRRRVPDLSDAVVAVALATNADQRSERFDDMLTDAFAPLAIDLAPAAVDRPVLVDEGAAMDLPGPGGLAARRLHWTRGGHRLYAPDDVARATRLLAAIERFDKLALARDRAVEEERARIDRDVHDNIGVQLLGALHSDNTERKNALIRQTLTDLRNIVANTKVDDAPLRDVVADLRGEIGSLYDAAGIGLNWTTGTLPQMTISASMAATLRAVLREATGNALRHSGAERVAVVVEGTTAGLSVTVEDDGSGISAAAVRGNGLDNLTLRAAAIGGIFDIRSTTRGTHLSAYLPFDAAPALPLAGE